MKAFAYLLFALPSIAAAAAAPGALLKAEVEGDTVVIYSSMKKAGGCKASVLFSYQKGDQRQTRRLECNFRVPGQDHYRFCRAQPKSSILKAHRNDDPVCDAGISSPCI